MLGKDELEGKKLLIVDDEPDVLEALKNLLAMCHITRATSFEGAKAFLESEHFDMAILDIMGVNGYELLKICRQKNITAVMLTAYAFTPKDMVKSFKGGAASYIPKEEMADIADFLKDVLKAQSEGTHPWEKWEERLPSSYFERRFGSAWKDVDRQFWETFRTSVQNRPSKAGKK